MPNKKKAEEIKREVTEVPAKAEKVKATAKKEVDRPEEPKKATKKKEEPKSKPENKAVANTKSDKKVVDKEEKPVKGANSGQKPSKSKPIKPNKKANNPDKPQEPVVDADFDEEKVVKKGKNSQKKETEELTYIRNVGSVSSDIQNDFVYNAPTKEEEEVKAYRFFKKCLRNGEILIGTVSGIEPDYKNNMWGVKVKYEPFYSKEHYGMVEVFIPETLFFEPGVKYPKDYESRNKKDQFHIRKSMLEAYQGALIQFCVIGVSRSKVDKPGYENEKQTAVIGDRNKAMEILRDKYFFHRNRKPETKEKPIVIKQGTPVEAFVVKVNPSFATVTALGIETIIKLEDLTSDSVTSCMQYTYPGDVLRECRVLDVTAKDGTINLRLTNRKMQAPKAILSMKRGSRYDGRVTWYNPKKDIYTVILSNGVTAFVPADAVVDGMQLSINDLVSVVVTNVYDEMVRGNCMKK